MTSRLHVIPVRHMSEEKKAKKALISSHSEYSCKKGKVQRNVVKMWWILDNSSDNEISVGKHELAGWHSAEDQQTSRYQGGWASQGYQQHKQASTSFQHRFSTLKKSLNDFILNKPKSAVCSLRLTQKSWH